MYDILLTMIYLPFLMGLVSWISNKIPLIWEQIMEWITPKIPTVNIKYTVYMGNDHTYVVESERQNIDYIEAIMYTIKPDKTCKATCMARRSNRYIQQSDYCELYPIYLIDGGVKYGEFLITSHDSTNDDKDLKSKTSSVIITHPTSYDAITNFLNETHQKYIMENKCTDDGKRYFFNKTKKECLKIKKLLAKMNCTVERMMASHLKNLMTRSSVGAEKSTGTSMQLLSGKTNS
jgi:hypothetical protein